MTKEQLKSLLSLSNYPCEAACEWAADRTPDKLELVAAANESWRRWVAVHTFDPEILSMLATDQCWVVRLRAAKNPYTPPGIMAILAADPDPDVSDIAAWNPNTPAEATI